MKKTDKKVRKPRESVWIRRHRLDIEDLVFQLRLRKAEVGLRQIACERTKLDLEDARIKLREDFL